MNKFLVFPCLKKSENENYNGPVVMLSSEANISFALFFPVSEENSELINYILDTHPSKYNINDGNALGIYTTMIASWEAGNRHLSGILMDTEYDQELEQDLISTRLVISNEHGDVDSIIRVNFIHAIIIAAMERREIMVTNALLDKLIPKDVDENGNEITDENEDEENNDNDNDDEDEDDDKTDDRDKGNGKKPEHKYPVDKEILDIAKKIINGKIK
jgi:hypothetical protein